MQTIKTQTPSNTLELRKALVNLVGDVQGDPEQAFLVFSASSTLTEGFVADIRVRDFQFVSDEPEGLGGTDHGPNPVEYVLGALAACQEIVVKAHATVLGIDVSEVDVEAEGFLDLHGFLGLTDTRPGFEEVKFTTTIKTTETDPVKLKKLEALARNNCPVLDIIQNQTVVAGEVRFTE